MNSLDHRFFFNWGRRMQTYGEVEQLIVSYMTLLSTLHPAFARWKLLTGDSSPPIPAGEGIRHILRSAPFSLGSDPGHFCDLGADGDLVDGSWCEDGFSFLFLAGLPEGPYNDDDQSQSILVQVDAGSTKRNSILLTLPDARGDTNDSNFVRQLFQKTIEHWNVDCARTYRPGLVAAINSIRDLPIGQLQAGWLTFLRNRYLAACIRPTDICHTELIDTDGVLFVCSDDSPDPGVPKDVERVRAIQAWMDEFHFDHEWTVYGGPADPDHLRYVQQVTGCQGEHSHAVSFVGFDGYDAGRDKLLFARLFRISDSWGTDLHPVYKTDRARLERLPYVVQARQHIAAVRYAGESTPIEWHVGLEAKARALETLLNDWAEIPSNQLRVVYTPPNFTLTDI